MNLMALPILSRIPLACHSRESGSPERFKKTGFLLSQERRIQIENDFFRKQLKACALEQVHMATTVRGELVEP
jgi:hypothetical protein